MKRLIIFTFCLFAAAQAIAQFRVEGMKLGYNFIGIQGEFAELEANRSFQAGLFTSWRPVPGIVLQPELLYYQRRFDADSHYRGRDAHVILDYVQIPVLVRYDPATVFSIRFGPVLGYKVSSVERFRLEPDDFTEEFYKDFDLNINGTIGLNFILFSRRTELSASYTYGLTNIALDMLEPQKARDFSISMAMYLNHKTPENDFQVFRQRVIEELSYILPAGMAERMQTATDKDQLENLTAEFWRENDPTPGTEINEYREEYQGRISVLRNMGIPPRSDRGRVLLLFGPPDDIYREMNTSISLGMARVIRAFEVWLYDQPAGHNRVPKLFADLYPGQKKYIFADFGYEKYTQIYSTEPGEIVDPALSGN